MMPHWTSTELSSGHSRHTSQMCCFMKGELMNTCRFLLVHVAGAKYENGSPWSEKEGEDATCTTATKTPMSLLESNAS